MDILATTNDGCAFNVFYLTTCLATNNAQACNNGVTGRPQRASATFEVDPALGYVPAGSSLQAVPLSSSSLSDQGLAERQQSTLLCESYLAYKFRLRNEFTI